MVHLLQLHGVFFALNTPQGPRSRAPSCWDGTCRNSRLPRLWLLKKSRSYSVFTRPRPKADIGPVYKSRVNCWSLVQLARIPYIADEIDSSTSATLSKQFPGDCASVIP